MKTKQETVSSLTQKLVRVFNAYIRERDKDLPCISCGSRNNIQAGHYFSAGHYTTLRFNEDNVNSQCVRCNMHLHGNQIEYRKGLIKKIGEERVRLLELSSDLRRVSRYSKFELEVLINLYKEKLKKLK